MWNITVVNQSIIQLEHIFMVPISPYVASESEARDDVNKAECIIAVGSIWFSLWITSESCELQQIE